MCSCSKVTRERNVKRSKETLTLNSSFCCWPAIEMMMNINFSPIKITMVCIDGRAPILCVFKLKFDGEILFCVILSVGSSLFWFSLWKWDNWTHFNQWDFRIQLFPFVDSLFRSSNFLFFLLTIRSNVTNFTESHLVQHQVYGGARHLDSSENCLALEWKNKNKKWEQKLKNIFFL